MMRNLESLSVQEKDDSLNAEFMNSAYSILWLGQKLPPFTTTQFSLSPFAPEDLSAESVGENTTISAQSIAYSTELICSPADIGRAEPYFWMSNNRGCNVTDIGFLPQADYIAQYIPWFNDPYVDYFLDGPTCSDAFANNFLAVFIKTSRYAGNKTSDFEYPNGVALFCEPKYYTQAVNATINVPDLSVASVIPVGPKEQLSKDFMNITMFEYIIGTGLLPGVSSGVASRREWPQQTMLDPYVKISNMNLGWPISNMVGFGLGIEEHDGDSFLNASVLHSSFEAAHQLLFALAVSGLPRDRTMRLGQGQKDYRIDSVYIAMPFAIVVEVALGLVALMTLFVFVYAYRRPSKMPMDPSSIADIVSLIPQDPKCLNGLAANHSSSMELLEERFKGHRFRLQETVSRGQLHAKIISQPLLHQQRATIQKEVSGEDCPRFRPAFPYELSHPIGIIFVAVMLGLLLSLGLLHRNIHLQNGLPLPSNNSIIQQVILNYIPTAIATLIEPFWVLLGRLLCIFQPFEHLRRGRPTLSASLNARYSSLPPQLVVWRAIRGRDYLLSLLCVMTVLANIFTVAVSGLFQQRFVDVYHPTHFAQTSLPIFQNSTSFSSNGHVSNAEDVFYINKVNLTRGTPLPPWVTKSHFFLPFELDQSQHLPGPSKLRAFTTGFSIEPQCRELKNTTSNDTFDVAFSGGTTTVSSSVSLNTDRGPVLCQILDDGANNLSVPLGKVALEHLTRPSAQAHDALESNVTCDAMMFAFWLHADSNGPTFSSSENPPPANLSLSGMFGMACLPVLKMSQFEVTVDHIGNILEAKEVLGSEVAPQQLVNQPDKNILWQLSSLVVDLVNPIGADYAWHNDTFASDWPNYLLKILTNSSAITDPSSPFPEFQSRAIAMEDLLLRLFAVMVSLLGPPFEPAPPGHQIVGNQVIGEWRVFMSEPMFYLAACLLSLNILVASALYVRRPRGILPRAPTSLGSIVAYCAASNMVREMDQLRHLSSKAREAYMERCGRVYGFGRFRGTDGKPRIGIEEWSRLDSIFPDSASSQHNNFASQLWEGAYRFLRR
ncbi:MAG: kinase-regulated stress-responsive transcription factor skn7 [Chaenotheca gracillima]|nr:MAG: kinase-regulated stress-responsive transcription factor skn7 [Chaenotheca gracillima]